MKFLLCTTPITLKLLDWHFSRTTPIYNLRTLDTQGIRKMPRSPRLAHKAPVMKAIRTVPRMSTMEPHLAEGKGKHVRPWKLPFQFTDDVNFFELFQSLLEYIIKIQPVQ